MVLDERVHYDGSWRYVLRRVNRGESDNIRTNAHGLTRRSHPHSSCFHSALPRGNCSRGAESVLNRKEDYDGHHECLDSDGHPGHNESHVHGDHGRGDHRRRAYERGDHLDYLTEWPYTEH